jgi:preprotein translocase subunit SecG
VHYIVFIIIALIIGTLKKYHDDTKKDEKYDEDKKDENEDKQ